MTENSTSPEKDDIASTRRLALTIAGIAAGTLLLMFGVVWLTHEPVPTMPRGSEFECQMLDRDSRDPRLSETDRTVAAAGYALQGCGRR